MSKSPRFQELSYKHPVVGASESCKAALTVINDLLTNVPSALPYVMEPSAILLFANLRALSPYHRFGNGVSDELKAQFDTVLLRHGLYRCTEDTAYDNPKSDVFSIINSAIFNEIPTRYGFVKNVWKTPASYSSVPQMSEWVLHMERAFVNLMESDTLPKEWLEDWWAPHNLRFGMLLGYPGIAISSSLWTTQEQDGISEVLVTKDNQYFGAQVAFYTESGTAKDPSITKLVRLWHETIEQVYNSLPLEKLLLNSEFAKDYRKLKQAETNQT